MLTNFHTGWNKTVLFLVDNMRLVGPSTQRYSGINKLIKVEYSLGTHKIAKRARWPWSVADYTSAQRFAAFCEWHPQEWSFSAGNVAQNAAKC